MTLYYIIPSGMPALCPTHWGKCPVSLSLQVPYETLNKRFRAAQKNIDRETSHVTMVVAELEKTLSSFPVVDSVVSLLDGVVEKLSALKRKVRNRCTHTHTFICFLFKRYQEVLLMYIFYLLHSISQDIWVKWVNVEVWIRPCCCGVFCSQEGAF